MKTKDCAAGVICALLCLGSLQTPCALCAQSSAQEKTEEEQASSKTISGFAKSGCLMQLEVDHDPLPDLETITDSMPDSLQALLNDGTIAEISPVKWVCREEYEKDAGYVFQFVPDLDGFILQDGLELPYVFLMSRDQAAEQGNEAVTSLAQGDSQTKSVTGLANETIIYQFLRQELGLNAAAACGILANIQDESYFNPQASALDTGGTHSFGICQWNSGYGRLNELASWCAANGYDFRSLEGQLRFLQHELSQGYGFDQLKAYPNTAYGAGQAAYHFASVYERCTPVRWSPRLVLARDTYWPVYCNDNDQTPLYCVDQCTAGFGKVIVKGWTYDPDQPDASLDLHVYLNGQVKAYRADRPSEDVNRAFGITGAHRFEIEVPTSEEGELPIQIYALNKGIQGSSNHARIYAGTVKVTQDRQKPEITLVSSELTAQGYSVICKVQDNDVIDRVQFAVWTDANGQDDLNPSWVQSPDCAGTKIGEDLWRFDVRTADHNEQTGTYQTHVYAWDASGNSGMLALPPVTLPDYHPDLQAPIILDASVSMNDTGYTVSCRVEEDHELSHIRFETWTAAGARNQAVIQDSRDAGNLIRLENGVYSCPVLAEDFDWQSESYTTAITAYDAYGNVSQEEIVEVKSIEADPETCTHPHTDWTIVQPTCTQEGTKRGYCPFCRQTIDEILPMTDHQAGEWQIIKKATEQEDGFKEKHCTVCNVLLEQAVIEKTGQGEWMLRLYNPNSGEHFYTLSQTERDDLVLAGWKEEGTAWKAPKESNVPVYRLYNPNSGDHHYTVSASEQQNLIKAGWRDEGIGWYALPDPGAPVFRLYNPNAKSGAHHYTLSAAERDNLIQAGWRDEGIGWYAMETAENE